MSVMDMNDSKFMDREYTPAPVQDAEIVTERTPENVAAEIRQIAERTPEIVAAEIRQIKDQTRKLVLNNSIEIGKRLCEAKEMVPHGEWGTWLERNVDYKQSTANKLMKIYEQYGAAQGELWGASAKSETFTNLTYSKALALLAVPEEEREEFVEKNNVENMSTRELQEAIKARNEAEEKLQKEKAAADERVRAAQRQAESVMEELDKLKDEVKNSKDKKELEKLKSQLKDAKDKLKAHENLHSIQMEEVEVVQKQNQEEINRLKAELAAAETKEPEPTEEMQAEIERLKEKLKKAELLGAERLAADEETARFKVLFQTVQNNFSDLMDAMYSIRNADIKSKGKAAIRALFERLTKELDAE